MTPPDQDRDSTPKGEETCLRSEREAVWGQFNTALVSLFLAAVCLMAAHFFRLPNLQDFWHSLEFNWRFILLGFVLTPPCIVFANLVKIVQLKYVGLDGERTDSPEVTATGSALIAVFSGFSEEVLFRGVIQPVLGIWVASAAFGLMHIDRREDWPYAIFTFVFGLVFGVIFQLTGSLWVPIILHVLNNFVAGNPPQWWTRLLTRVYSRALGA